MYAKESGKNALNVKFHFFFPLLNFLFWNISSEKKIPFAQFSTWQSHFIWYYYVEYYYFFESKAWTFVSSTWAIDFQSPPLNEKCSLSSPRETERKLELTTFSIWLSYSTCVPSYYFDYRHYVYPSVSARVDWLT